MLNKIAKLEQLLKLANEGLTREEFIEFLGNIVKLVKRVEIRLDDAISGMSETHIKLKDKIKSDSELSLTDLRALMGKEMSRINKSIDDKIKEADTKLGEVKNGENGKDADEVKIVKNVLAQIVIPEYKETILDDAFEIRNKLETLNDDDRLEIVAIKDLREELDEIKQIKSQSLGGGGLSKISMDIHILDPYTPTGTVNGTNKDFVLQRLPNPSTSLKVYKDGQKMQLTTDYTLSDKTITFITAPLTDSIIEVEHRI